MLPHGAAHRPAVCGTRGVVTSAHFLASMAGAEMLLEGGNAMDAAIATAVALNVVEFYRSGLGGAGVMVVSSARRRERLALDFTGFAPHASDPARTAADELQVGPKAALTPGALGGWLAALERFGTMPRDKVFAPAIRLAERGFPLSLRTCDFLRLALPRLAASDEGRRVVRGGGTPRPGAIFVQADMARTLRQIVEGGAGVLYGGPLGRAIANGVEQHGGWLRESDLEAYKPHWQSPLGGNFDGVDLIIPPPPCSGWQILETLHILEGFELKSLGHNSADYLHLFIEAAKLAASDRVAYAHAEQAPVRSLITKAYAGERRLHLDRLRASASGGERFSRDVLPGQVPPGRPDLLAEETTHFATADTDMVVNVTQSLGNMFGSGFMVPGTGVFLNNFLAWTDLDAESPNYLRGGEQIELMMTPVQAFRDDRFALSIGTPGSYGILQTTPQMILNHLVFDLNIQEAIEAPRVCTRRKRAIDVEARIPAAIRSALATRGHEINLLDEHEGWSWTLGGAHGIARDAESGSLAGGADPRRDGYAIAI
ncbi:MAG TPA: gamma-glutamyltransferase family protein [bacterium]|nr:gamma-glutamyltransferase family protein [bacterium]